MIRIAGGWWGLTCLLAFAACGKEPTGQYNVVLISIDSLRADRTGPYGHQAEFAPEIPVTPNLDRLAQSGAVFEDAWSSSSWTLPSHMAMMTGLTDRAHGVEHQEFRLDPLRRTLAEQFQADGYATGGCYSGPFLDPKYGFDRGFADYASGMITPEEFDKLVEGEKAKRSALGQQLRSREIGQLRDKASYWDVTSPRVNSFARNFLSQHQDQRFFLFLHYYDAHYDYLPEVADKNLAVRFDPGYSGKLNGADWYFDGAQQVMSWPSAAEPEGTRIIDERDLRHALALYDAEIHWVDRHVGEVLDQIAALGLEDETIVIVTSGHGEEFFEHGSIGHRSSLYAELCRVPLILRVPGAGQKGLRVTELARGYDVAPSLLDWCGLPPLAEAQGASLRPLLEGQEDGRSVLHRIYARFNRDRLGNHNVREAFRNEEFTVVRHLQPLDRQATSAGLPFASLPDPRFGRDFLVFDRIADPIESLPLQETDPRWRQALEAYRDAWNICETQATSMSQSVIRDRRCIDKLTADPSDMVLCDYGRASRIEESLHPDLLPFPAPCLPPR